MPTYTYKCPDAHYSEEHHSMSAYPQTTKCPGCGQDAMLVIRPVSIQLNIDHQDQQGMDLGAGIPFQSRRERRVWMHDNGKEECGDTSADRMHQDSLRRRAEECSHKYDEAMKNIESFGAYI